VVVADFQTNLGSWVRTGVDPLSIMDCEFDNGDCGPSVCVNSVCGESTDSAISVCGGVSVNGISVDGIISADGIPWYLW